MNINIRKIGKYIWIGLAIVAIMGIIYKTYPYMCRAYLTIDAYVRGSSYIELHESEGRFIRQVVTKDIDTSRMIMWHSDMKEANPLIEVREVGSDAIRIIAATERIFTDDGETVYIHEGIVDQLDSDKNYEYRIGFENKRSKWMPLKEKQKERYQVLIYPDSQSADYTDWTSIVKNSYEKNKDALFYISMGDLVDNGEQASQWRAWFNAVEPLSLEKPVAPLMGNHETYNLDWKIREPLAYLAYFSVPSNGNERYKGRYYSYDVGPVHYVVLDTQMKEEEEFHPHIGEAQMEWLRNDLSSNKSKWTVVLMHKDSFQYANNRRGGEPGFNQLGRLFMPIFDEFKVDLVLSAHLHTYRNRGNVKNFERNEEGPIYILTGIAGDVRYPNLWIDHPLDVVVAPQPETNNYMTLDVSNQELRIKSFLPDGTIIDDVTIRKDMRM